MPAANQHNKVSSHQAASAPAQPPRDPSVGTYADAESFKSRYSLDAAAAPNPTAAGQPLLGNREPRFATGPQEPPPVPAGPPNPTPRFHAHPPTSAPSAPGHFAAVERSF
eukprot:1177433-Pyramimonas_sp.AAC.1